MNKLILHIAADHPTGSGHFPGHPIIPGALLLAEVLHCIGQAEALRCTSCNVKAAKFLHPARPGDTVEIEYVRSAQGAIEFRCVVAGIGVMTGAVNAADYA